MPVPRLYYVIGLHAGWADPTAAQIKAGLLSTGLDAAASGSEPAPTATTTYDFLALATGLTPSTQYRVAFVWTDGASLDSNVNVSGIVETTAGSVSLTPAALMHEHAMLAAGLSLQSSIAAASMLHEHAIGAPAVTKADTLVADAMGHAHAFGAGSLSAEAALVANALTHGHVLSSADTSNGLYIQANSLAHAHQLSVPELQLSLTIIPGAMVHIHVLSVAAVYLGSPSAAYGRVLEIRRAGNARARMNKQSRQR